MIAAPAEAIARAIAAAREEYDATTRAVSGTEGAIANAALDTASTLLAAELSKLNPAFDRAHFLRACGMER